MGRARGRARATCEQPASAEPKHARLICKPARGGRYEGTELDTQTAFVRNFLAFVGLKDVEFIYAEGLAMGEDARNAGLGFARARIEAVAA